MPELFNYFQLFFLRLLHCFFCSLMDQFCYQPGPASLVARSAPTTIVSVEIFVKQNVFIEVWVLLHFFIMTLHCPVSLRIFFENINQTACNRHCCIFNSGKVPGVRWILYHKILAIVSMEFHQ
jgi:hypothetical protein